MARNSTALYLIKTQRLTRVYSLGEVIVPAVKDISIEIKKGEFVAIMGPSGSGKSTLLNLIGCLDTASEGDYFLDDIKVTKDLNLAKVRNQKIGFIFQTFNLLPRMNALENVELPMIYAGVGPSSRNAKARSLLEKLGLGNRVRHRPNELSGGERQRVAIARALANDPPLILADEPTGNLDSKSGAEVLGILKELNNDGKTIIMVTHDPELGKKADRILHIKDGQIIS